MLFAEAFGECHAIALRVTEVPLASVGPASVDNFQHGQRVPFIPTEVHVNETPFGEHGALAVFHTSIIVPATMLVDRPRFIFLLNDFSHTTGIFKSSPSNSSIEVRTVLK